MRAFRCLQRRPLMLAAASIIVSYPRMSKHEIEKAHRKVRFFLCSKSEGKGLSYLCTML